VLLTDRGLEKYGKGIYRREFIFVPSSGPGSIKRRNVQHADTLKESSKLHRLCSTSYAGYVDTSEYSCPLYCESCVARDWDKCEYRDQTGPVTRGAQIDAKGLNANFGQSRQYYENRGGTLGACIELGDFVAWEDGQSDSSPYCIIRVTKEAYQMGIERSVTLWNGAVIHRRDDSVFEGRRLYPSALDLVYSLSPVEEPVILDCKSIRKIKFNMRNLNGGRSTRSSSNNMFEIEEDDLAEIRRLVSA